MRLITLIIKGFIDSPQKGISYVGIYAYCKARALKVKPDNFHLWETSRSTKVLQSRIK